MYALRSCLWEKLVLISTVDAVCGKDSYGLHRAELEKCIASHRDTYIVRLPALFGNGLKKNALYDLMMGDRLDEIAPNAVYQWYPLRTLGMEICGILRGEPRAVNILSEPIAMEELRWRFFPHRQIGQPRRDAAFYDLPKESAELWLSKDDVFKEMSLFLGRG